MEYLDIVDEENNLLGKIEEREIVHRDGLWHREVCAWIINERGELLIQKRSANKKQQPNMWELCAGHIDAGEDIQISMIRELEEEIGLKADIKDLELISIEKKANTYGDIKNYNFQYNYYIKTDKKIEEYKIQLEELSELKYISITELEEIVNTKDPDYTFSNQSYMQKIIKVLNQKNIEGINIKIGSYIEIGKDAQIVRDNVFCGEQNISKDIEQDSYDATATHIVLYKNNVPIATGRIAKIENNHYIGRVAVLREYRGNGYGNLIVKSLVDWAFENNISEVYLHSQKHAEEFYKKIGFQAFGEVFYEAGIEHINMVIKKD